DAMRLAQRRRNVGHVPDPEHDRVGVEAAVSEAQFFRILDLPRQIQALTFGTLLADLEHVGVDVRDRYLCSAPRHSKGDVAGAPGHVEDGLAGAWLHAIDEAILPQPVHPARHQVVHQVVAPRDRAEDGADAPRLLLGANELVAEIDLGLHGPAPLAGLAAVRHIAPPCPSSPKSKPRSAAWRASSTGDGSPASKPVARTSGGPCRSISASA